MSANWWSELCDTESLAGPTGDMRLRVMWFVGRSLGQEGRIRWTLKTSECRVGFVSSCVEESRECGDVDNMEI